MEGHGISWWEPLFEGMCYMHGMCFDMLTPTLYISVCRKIYGVIPGKGFAHVPMVNYITLDHVYRSYSACGRVYGATHKRKLSIFPFSWCVLGGGSKVSLCVHVGIQVGGWYANGPKHLCFESHVDTMGERSYILL